MRTISLSPYRGLVVALFLASVASAPALAQSQSTPQPATVNPAAGPYSGQADTAAKQGPEGCQSPTGAAQAKTPEQLAKAIDASKNSPYEGKENGVAKNTMATCGGQ